MKNLTLLVVVLLITTTAAFSQAFQAGIKVGVGSSNVSIDNVRNDPWQYADDDNITSYHAGIFTRLNLGPIFLQPEAVVTSSGGKVEITDNSSSIPSVRTEEFDFNRLDVPLMVGVSFLNVVRVQVGPVASMMLSAKQEGDDIDDYLNKSDWGWQAGVGLDISRITLDLRYERIKRELTNDTRQSSFDINSNQILLSLGFKLTR
ncbi:porin family protein [Pontibacter harenae]|uniref:porin family protein n=1 Tax=Pontibacter harenae TaxID=2894083 RepID=UPI001E446E78|nr:porin family protein [Pontibacter harenae]MCC9166701.1 PorT family protein [Pontibacter harenae]